MAKMKRNQDDVDKLLKLMMNEGEASDSVKDEIGDLVKKYNEMLKTKGKPRAMKKGGKVRAFKNGGAVMNGRGPKFKGQT